jgi:hypothetical protein
VVHCTTISTLLQVPPHFRRRQVHDSLACVAWLEDAHASVPGVHAGNDIQGGRKVLRADPPMDTQHMALRLQVTCSGARHLVPLPCPGVPRSCTFHRHTSTSFCRSCQSALNKQGLFVWNVLAEHVVLSMHAPSTAGVTILSNANY